MSAKRTHDNVIRVSFGGSVEERAARLYTEASALDTSPATWDRAIELYKQALAVCPDHALSMTNLANVYFRQGRTRDARDLYFRAVQRDPRQPEAHYNLGYLAMDDGQIERALQWFLLALERDPTFADAHFNAAMCLEQLDKPLLARRHWKAALQSGTLLPEHAQLARGRFEALK